MKKITLLLLFLAAMQAYAQPSEIIITAPTGASLVKITGPWWSWDPNGGPEAVQNSDGDWVISLNGAGSDMEYLIVVDGVQENLIDNAAGGECTTRVDAGNIVTDYWSYANRKWLSTDPFIYTETYDSCQQIASLGLEDISANAIKMYPNPANGVVYFSTSVNDALTVSVFDLLGKQVMDAQNVQSQLNISSLNPGMYFVKMTQGSNVSTKKLLVK